MTQPARISEATADRLAEAAQLLLDAARAAHTENPGFKAGREYIAEPVALAVQALFMADVWDQGRQGSEIKLDRYKTAARIRGMGCGVGISIAALPPIAQLPCTLALQTGLNEGLTTGRAARGAVR